MAALHHQQAAVRPVLEAEVLISGAFLGRQIEPRLIDTAIQFIHDEEGGAAIAASPLQQRVVAPKVAALARSFTQTRAEIGLGRAVDNGFRFQSCRYLDRRVIGRRRAPGLLSENRLGKDRYGCEGEYREGGPKALHDRSVPVSVGNHQQVITIFRYRRVEMSPKLHTPPDLQLLVNTVMPWAERLLRATGRIPAAAAWLSRGDPEPKFRTGELNQNSGLKLSHDSPLQSVAHQEAMLVVDLEGPWRRQELTAVLLAAPVLFGRSGSGERSPAVRLHVEARDGYCADILMPYRIRTGWRSRGSTRNRVHFTHPVAHESDSRFSSSPAPLQNEHADKT
jgi:hypothetical protein